MVELVVGPSEVKLVDVRVVCLVECLAAVEATPRLAFLQSAEFLGVFGVLNWGDVTIEMSNYCNHNRLYA